MRSHLKVYFNFEEDTNALNDSEKGRLLLAMVRYAKDGTEANLTGNERFLFPVFKAQIDRDIESYEVKVNNGSKGGRPKTNENQEKPTETENNLTESKKTETPKIEDRRKKIEEKDKDKDNRKFVPPSVDEVRAYCQERGNNIDPEYFIAYNENRNWTLSNGRKMKDWKLAIVTWEKNNFSKPQTAQGAPRKVVAQQYSQMDYSTANEENDFDRLYQFLESS